jgi:hypothetical protein
MQHVPRPAAAPDALNSEAARRSRKVMQRFMTLEKGRRSQTSVPQVGMDPNDAQLVQALASFTRGKCAFCEAREKLVAHRFRPSGNAQPAADRKDAHLFYVWLVDAWQNLLPICEGCRPIEPIFPVESGRCKLPTPQQVNSYVEKGAGLWPSYPPKERNLLIDPSRETGYDKHLKPRLDGTLVATSPRAALTVETFNLNRADRLRRRGAVFAERLKRLRKLLGTSARAKISASDQKAWTELFDFRELEFGGTWLLLLKRVAARIDPPDGTNSGTLQQAAETGVQAARFGSRRRGPTRRGACRGRTRGP